MESLSYGIGRFVPDPYDDVMPRVKDALKAEGFGVLTEIDVQATLKAKLGVERGKYAILGACSPSHAHKALQAEPELGLLLPCNVVVYETEPGRSVVSAMAPIAAMGIVGGNPALKDVAREADERLRRALKALEAIAAPAGS